MRTLRWLLITLITLVIIAAILMAVYGFYSYRRPLPQTEGSIQIPELRETVTVYRDDWGIPNIYAATPQDLFFAQGYVHAQDRWWQMEVARYAAQGRLFEITGAQDEVIKLDQFIRTVNWVAIAEGYWQAATPDTRAALEAYSDGVNAYLESRNKGDLALEYTILEIGGIGGGGLEVERWEPLHSLLLMVALAWSQEGNFDEELLRAELSAGLDSDWLETYLPDWGVDPLAPFIVPPEHLPPLDTENLPPLPPIFPPDVDYSAVNHLIIGGLQPHELTTIMQQLEASGNAWVVDGSRTASGAPLLAGDMHTAVTMPSIWYMNGLHCIDAYAVCPYNVMGFSLPGVPAVMVGHNEALAWTLTSARVDTQDIYLIRRHPDDPTLIEIDGDWQPITLRSEQIDLDHDKRLRWQVPETPYGPIISQPDQTGLALALNWTAYRAVDPLSGLLKMNAAQDMSMFQTALQSWGWSPYHVLVADQAGNIGYQMVGQLPVRSSLHSGLAPVPGWESGYAWRGYLPMRALPGVSNPAQGWLVAADQAAVPPAYAGWLAEQYADQFGADANYYFMLNTPPASPAAARLAVLLAASDAHTQDSFAVIQTDTYSQFAEALLDLLNQVDLSAEQDAELLAYRDWLNEWDYHYRSDSPYPVLLAMFWTQLQQMVLADRLPMVSDGMVWNQAAILNLPPDHAWWDNTLTAVITETRDAAVRTAFRAAIETAEQAFDPIREDWQWGDLHLTEFRTQPLGYTTLGDLVNQSNIPTSGGLDSINAARWQVVQPDRYETITLPSYRMIIDAGNFSDSRGILSTGQSAHPASEHYPDMIDFWRDGQYIRWLWEPDAIRQNAISMLKLQP